MVGAVLLGQQLTHVPTDTCIHLHLNAPLYTQ